MITKENKNHHKLLYFLIITSVSLIGLYFQNKIHAEDLTSNNYKIIDATINSSGQVLNSSSYKTVTAIGDFSSNPRYYSNSYQIKGGTPEAFTANVPLVHCFETDTNGSSNCSNGPSYLNTNGMVTVCGEFGCYDKARVEIDTQGNPSDTLYSVEISKDNFNSDIEVIDPTSRQPKDISQKTTNDFMTADKWHDYNNSFGTGWSHSYNIQGLKPNTTYYVRITALQGDLTESAPSPVLSATTSVPTLSFDIDIAPPSNSSVETQPPHTLSMFLIPDTVVTSNDSIWQDLETNLNIGLQVTVKGLHGGLYNSIANHIIPSQTTDLSTVSEGFGLQKLSTNQGYDTSSNTGELSTINTATDYNSSGNNVGKIETNENTVFSTNGPLYNGKTDSVLKARATNTTPNGNYTETITFLVKANI